jgi:hypothetical protein
MLKPAAGVGAATAAVDAVCVLIATTTGIAAGVRPELVISVLAAANSAASLAAAFAADCTVGSLAALMRSGSNSMILERTALLTSA